MQRPPENGSKFKERSRKKLIESINEIQDVEEKISFLSNRLLESDAYCMEQRREIDRLKNENGRVEVLEKKISSLERQLSKAEMAKSKMEQLCRELSKAQKEEKEYNQQKLRLLQATHAETVNSLKKSLSEIQQSVADKEEHGTKVAEVEKLSANLNQLASDYDLRLKELKKLYDEREADMNQLTKAKDEEMTALKSQVENMNKRVLEVFEENVKLKKQLLASEEKAQASMESEIGLKKMLDGYSEKYSKLLESLSHSNNSFERAKKDISRMNGNLIKLEANGRKWQTQAEEANKTISTITNENDEYKKKLALKDRQLNQLQELCRKLVKEGNNNNDNTEPGSATNGDRTEDKESPLADVSGSIDAVEHREQEQGQHKEQPVEEGHDHQS